MNNISYPISFSSNPITEAKIIQLFLVLSSLSTEIYSSSIILFCLIYSTNDNKRLLNICIATFFICQQFLPFFLFVSHISKGVNVY